MARDEHRDENGNVDWFREYPDPSPKLDAELAAAYQDVVTEVAQISDPHTKQAFAKLKILLRLAFKRLGMED